MEGFQWNSSPAHLKVFPSCMFFLMTLLVLQELVNNLSYNEKSDVWSLGCMLYELCALAPPFTASNQSELNRKIRVGEFSRLPSQYSQELELIIRRMIQVEVSFVSDRSFIVV